MSNLNRVYPVVKDADDRRDFLAAPEHPIQLPSRVDNFPHLGPVRDQLNQGSCTGQTGAGILDYEFRKRRGQSPVFSAEFVYWEERTYEGDVSQDAGAESRTMMKVLANIGACLDSSDPYSDGGWQNQPSPAMVAEAAQFKIGEYHRITDLQTLKAVLAAGGVASIGFTVYESFESDATLQSGSVTMPAQGENILGGHEVLVFGYDDHDRRIFFRNSWGACGYLSSGNFSMPYEYWPDIMDCWTCSLPAQAVV